MNSNSKKVKKLVFKHLDRIYRTSVKVSNPWGPGMVGVPALKKLVELSKLQHGTAIGAEFVEQYNTLLDLLIQTAENNMSKTGFIPKQLLASYITIIKNSFEDGLNNQDKLDN